MPKSNKQLHLTCAAPAFSCIFTELKKHMLRWDCNQHKSWSLLTHASGHFKYTTAMYSDYILGHHNLKFAAAGKQSNKSNSNSADKLCTQGCSKAGTTPTYQLQSGRWVPGQGAKHRAAPSIALQLLGVWNRPCWPVYEHQWARLGRVALAVSLSEFHSGCHLVCCTDWTVMLKSSLLWVAWSSLDCLLLATVVEVSISHL